MSFLGSCSATKRVTLSFRNQLLSVELHAVVDELAIDVDRPCRRPALFAIRLNMARRGKRVHLLMVAARSYRGVSYS
jgi:hypothetical protein